MSRIAVHNVTPNPEQPRKYFDQAELEGLAASMAGPSGLIQPITVDRRRYSRATFKRATDAEIYGLRLLARINRMCAEKESN